MSQPQNPTDTQALVQSMLQRLKLQPGRESQAYLHTPALSTPVPTCRPDVETEASSDQKVKTSPVRDSGKNGIPEEFRISSVHTDDGPKGGEINGGPISSAAQKDNIDGETGENAGLSQDGMSPTGTGQLLPAKSFKDADISSFEKTNGERVRSGSSAMTKDASHNTDTALSMGQNPELDRGFTPRVYLWSLKSTDTGTGGQEDKPLHVGNSGLGALATTTVNSSFRKKQRPPEKKTKRWTAKIKERWRDRQGSFGKKGKEEGGMANHEGAKGTDVLTSNQTSTGENPFNSSKNDQEAMLSSPGSKGPSETPPAHTEDSTVDGHFRSIGDFEFGLGSFSLLDEITKGQEWAKFLNPNVFAAPANQTPSEEMQVQLKNQPDPHTQSGVFNQANVGNNQWSFSGVEPSNVFSGAQMPVSMDVTEGKQTDVRMHADVDQSEPMEDGQNLSDTQPSERERMQSQSPAESQPSENLRSPVTRNRMQLTRKRHHQSAERLQPEKMSEGEEADQDAGEDMEQKEGARPESHMPNSHPINPSPSTVNPTFLPPRGVLKHSISRDSQSSMETLSKRRRVEENRHVHFSEEVVFIQSAEPDLDVTVSEEDSEEEEDTVSEQEVEVERVAVEEVAPARRPALPNWILALKRRNTGRKPR
ncbi:A-kinase anchor protein 200 [Salarias fasciatus]|uniref:A-kinase anchor protein 200 n=1 Tax=Salarias fasciatus TaxID=181472 RepID=UPI001176CF29|nr:A-kinase anchor protein 200-like [Salarias fasciatus]XP_029964796.1 A-kinase anchor protein 200-like [Salarias fasciatus]XP_029964804.1 A-kinase anchor protein 200-like [Salarias fasciatus]